MSTAELGSLFNLEMDEDSAARPALNGIAATVRRKTPAISITTTA